MKIESKKDIFKQYDVRGVYKEELDEELAAEIARTLSEKVFKKGRVLVGHDARNSSPSLYKAVLEALEENSELEVEQLGMITTPMLYFLVEDLKAEGGVMITASHNPKEYNGLKVVGRDSQPINGKSIYKLMK